MLCQMLEPVKPLTTAGKPVGSGAASMNARQALAVSIMLLGGPLAHAFGIAVAPDVWRQNHLVPLVDLSHTAWPTR